MTPLPLHIPGKPDELPAKDQSELRTFAPAVPADPVALAITVLQPGGVLEVYEKRAGALVRIAFIGDVTSGLSLHKSLTALDTLEFSLPYDVFVVPPGQAGGFLRDKTVAWKKTVSDQTLHSPYDKIGTIRDDVYLLYTQPSGRKRVFRVATLDEEDLTHMSGTATDAAIVLSDYLTQYVAGTSQFQGDLPSEIADHFLRGRQSIMVSNRKFARNSPIRYAVSEESPDQTPAAGDGTTAKPGGPRPMVELFGAISPGDAGLFSGLPHETVPPEGTKRPLTPGGYSYLGFNNKVVANGYQFEQQVSQGTYTGTLDFSTAAALFTGETATNVSHVFYGAILTTVAGTYGFRVNSPTYLDGFRVYFGWNLLYSNMEVTLTKTFDWTASLDAATWYPFVIHHGHATSSQALKLQWNVPASGSLVTIPATNLSPDLHGGFTLCRFVDVQGAIRFVNCFKDWRGRGLIFGYPIPATKWPAYITQPAHHWPQAMPPGTLIEEVRFPLDRDQTRTQDWGTGWTRRAPKVVGQAPSAPLARFQADADNY